MELIPLDDETISQIARAQVSNGRCVRCIGVPAVTLKCTLQDRQCHCLAFVIQNALLTLSQLRHTGPSGQRAFSNQSRAATSSGKSELNSLKERPSFMEHDTGLVLWSFNPISARVVIDAAAAR